MHLYLRLLSKIYAKNALMFETSSLGDAGPIGLKRE